MSHDRNGTLLEVGDIVALEFRVTNVSPDGTEPNLYCNANIETVEGLPGNGLKSSIGSINTKQLLLIKKKES